MKANPKAEHETALVMEMVNSFMAAKEVHTEKEAREFFRINLHAFPGATDKTVDAACKLLKSTGEFPSK